MPKYSIIIPVYNRPDEVRELLESLTHQSYRDFEVLIVEDGSTVKCEQVVSDFTDRLSISYYYKGNSGQGFSRNYGFERACGDWLIVFDSDCIIPSHYFEAVEAFLSRSNVDAYGGPDMAHESFTPVQKAISYSMTSIFTTGGIRGNEHHVGIFHPRSFNMGIHKAVFEKTGGYILPKKGEDIEFSIRIIENGFSTALIPEAFVYHKRRTSFRQFFRQLHFFGTARINVFRFYRKELKVIHLFPSVFIIGLILSSVLAAVGSRIGQLGVSLYVLYFVLVLIDSAIRTKRIYVALLSVYAAFIQLSAYGLGLIKEGLIYLRRG